MPWSKYDSAGNPLGVAAFSAGMSTLGQTAGTAGLNNQQLVLVGTGGITLSGSTANNGATITIVPPADASYFAWNSAAFLSSSQSNMALASASLVRMELPQAVTFTRIDVPVSVSFATAGTTATAAVDLSFIAALYTRNGSTLNPILGVSSTTTYTWASNSGVVSSQTGPRLLSFNMASRLSAGEYYFGLQISSHSGSSIGLSTTSLSMTMAPIFGTTYTVLPWQYIGVATDQSINLLSPLQGVNSVSLTATNQTHQQSQITQSGTAGARANLIVIFRAI